MNSKILILFSLLSALISTSSFATKTTENRRNTIEAHCKNQKVVPILKLKSRILEGEALIFYDCSLKNIYINSAKENYAPVEFTFAVNHDLELYFYLLDEKRQTKRSRKIEVVLSKHPTVKVSNDERVERNYFDPRRNLSRSMTNFPFLFSITNVPGYSDE